MTLHTRAKMTPSDPAHQESLSTEFEKDLWFVKGYYHM